jgi:hypothetical protein
MAKLIGAIYLSRYVFEKASAGRTTDIVVGVKQLQ